MASAFSIAIERAWYRPARLMLLLLPHEQIAEPLPLDLPEEGLRGVILPVGDGSIAILGEDGESMDPLADRIDSAVEWSI